MPRLYPLPGRRLPRNLRARQVDRVAARLAQGVRDPDFAHLIQRIDSAPLHRGHRVRTFVRGDEAFAAMRRAISEAETEVLVEAYILRDDGVGTAFLDDLARAVDRGVTVRVVADAVGSFGTKGEFWRRMKRRGIDVRLFNPLVKSSWNPIHRDHRKILVVDRAIAFTGGMNLGEEYGSVEVDRRASAQAAAWRDTHLEVRGPVALEMAAVFSESWLQAGGEAFEMGSVEIESPESELGQGEAAETGEPPRRSEADRTAAIDAPAQDARDDAEILVLDSGPFRGNAEAAAVLSAIAGAARDRLWITNAYFAPPRTALRILGRAAERGVDVRLLLPGITDMPLVRHAGHGVFSPLLDQGIRIFEYQPAILHAKSLVADGYASVIGSTNLDFRSFRLNAECNLVMLDEETGQALEAVFEDDLRSAHEIVLEDWKERSWPHRLGDRVARWLSPLL